MRPAADPLLQARCLVLVAALAVTACDRGDNTAEEMAPSGEAVGAREGPQRPPEAQAEGMWQLAEVNGLPVPAPVLPQEGECQVEVLDATLRLEANRFAFQNRTREICNGTAEQAEPVLHAAGGTYTREGDVLTFTTDVGAAFASARGRADETDLMLSELSTDAGTEQVSWRFTRRDAQLVPVPGTTGPASTAN